MQILCSQTEFCQEMLPIGRTERARYFDTDKSKYSALHQQIALLDG